MLGAHPSGQERGGPAGAGGEPGGGDAQRQRQPVAQLGELREALSQVIREVIRLVQDARKSSGLAITDRIDLWWTAAS
ncbi:hypothetical protein AB0K48_21405, partial [Nonomuraea sp. NPDC055795]